MENLFDKLKDWQPKSSKGGEINSIIDDEKLIFKINQARTAQNISNYRIHQHMNKTLSKEQFKRLKVYLPLYDRARIWVEFRKAYGDTKSIKPNTIRDLISVCKNSDNFYWKFCAELKKKREERKSSLKNQPATQK